MGRILFDLTNDQKWATVRLKQHDYKSSPLVICGFAGTGKSWLASTILPRVFPDKTLVYAAPSHKAVRQVLRSGLKKAGYEVSDFPRGKERLEEGFTAPISAGTVFSLLNFPKWELVCENSGKTCKEGEQCSSCRALDKSDPASLDSSPKSCLLKQSDLLSDPRDEPLSGADVIVIDESSMLGYSDYQQLCDHCYRLQIPLILLGDPGQLPPIPGRGEPRNFSALANPNIVMTEIRRQNEGNPIIRLSQIVREDGYLNPGWSAGPLAHVLPYDLGESILAATDYFAERAASGDMIICVRHDGSRPGGRVWHNMRARKFLGFPSDKPVPGDVVVAMASDYSLGQVHNSDRGEVLEAGEPYVHFGERVIDMVVKFPYRRPCRVLAIAKRFNYPANKTEDDWKIPKSVPLSDSLRGKLAASRPEDLTWQERKMLDTGRQSLVRLDYGYALTAWKAQGDEARGVLVTGAFDRIPHVDRRKYLYTAITRAKEEIVVG